MNTQERIDIIKKIMKHKKPPFDENDIYYERKPWNKFGAVCDTGSIGVGWCWYKVSVILSKVTDEELILALEEIENVNMTIDEAIAQLKELRKCEKYLYPSDIKAIDIALEHMDLYGTYISMNMHNKLYKKQKSINYELVDENQELINENKELKRLLRLAVDGIERIGKWKHAEEALKLIGDEDNG